MDTTPFQLRQQLARDYTRARLRDAAGRRAGRIAARQRQSVEAAPTPPAAVRRWWTLPVATTA
jgi:hypothetical protein